MKKVPFIILATLFTVFLFSACDPSSDTEIEQEVITKVSLIFLDDKGNSFTASWSDPDGTNGIQPPRVDKIILDANTNYTANVEVHNETTNPVTNLTNEISAEKEAHLWIYSYDKDNAIFKITDFDKNGKAVGLALSASTKSSGNGILKAVLKHNPDKNSTNPSNTGETDIDVNFEVVIK